MLNREEIAYIMEEAEQMRGDIVQEDEKGPSAATRRASSANIARYL
jgi:hypothetical protein